MRPRQIRTGVVLVGVLLTVLIGGCASTPPERPDRERIKQDSEKGMQDLKEEENRRRGTDY
ncbi:MAG: hypothetical protein HY204_10525 [Nitrospirae bacterium]|nr:hypothetical protein [Nitrospirota bacterium]